MDKKSKEIIKEVISDILKLRKKKLRVDTYSDTDFQYIEHTERFKEERIERKQQYTMEEYDIPLVKLNKLLKYEDKFDEVLEIEKQMTKIQTKKYITVKEFAEIYNISRTSQQNYRGRLYDALPHHQKVQGGKIVYVVEEVENWFDNQHK